MLLGQIWYGMSNMDEKETPQNPAEETPQAGQNTELVSDAELAEINDWAAPANEEEAAAAAKRIFDLENTLVGEEAEEVLDEPITKSVEDEVPASQPEQERAAQRKTAVKRLAVATATTLATAGAGVVALEHFDREPVFSQETTTYTLQPGDGLGDAAQAIERSNEIDLRNAVHYIEVHPANIDVLKGGLEPGEQIVIPVSVVSY